MSPLNKDKWQDLLIILSDLVRERGTDASVKAFNRLESTIFSMPPAFERIGWEIKNDPQIKTAWENVDHSLISKGIEVGKMATPFITGKKKTTIGAGYEKLYDFVVMSVCNELDRSGFTDALVAKMPLVIHNFESVFDEEFISKESDLVKISGVSREEIEQFIESAKKNREELLKRIENNTNTKVADRAKMHLAVQPASGGGGAGSTGVGFDNLAAIQSSNPGEQALGYISLTLIIIVVGIAIFG